LYLFHAGFSPPFLLLLFGKNSELVIYAIFIAAAACRQQYLLV